MKDKCQKILTKKNNRKYILGTSQNAENKTNVALELLKKPDSTKCIFLAFDIITNIIILSVYTN